MYKSQSSFNEKDFVQQQQHHYYNLNGRGYSNTGVSKQKKPIRYIQFFFSFSSFFQLSKPFFRS